MSVKAVRALMENVLMVSTRTAVNVRMGMKEKIVKLKLMNAKDINLVNLAPVLTKVSVLKCYFI